MLTVSGNIVLLCFLHAKMFAHSWSLDIDIFAQTVLMLLGV
jgi:hypothetical protein